jgi:hypothetical protein
LGAALKLKGVDPGMVPRGVVEWPEDATGGATGGGVRRGVKDIGGDVSGGSPGGVRPSVEEGVTGGGVTGGDVWLDVEKVDWTVEDAKVDRKADAALDDEEGGGADPFFLRRSMKRFNADKLN